MITANSNKENISYSNNSTDDILDGGESGHEVGILSRSRKDIVKEISKLVVRHKLQKMRHLVLKGAVSTKYLEDEIFCPKLLKLFDPQTVTYNGGIAKIKEWKISCYLEVMEGGVPCTNPNTQLLEVFKPLLQTCDDLFLAWYNQQHPLRQQQQQKRGCSRLMTFVTRYTARVILS